MNDDHCCGRRSDRPDELTLGFMCLSEGRRLEDARSDERYGDELEGPSRHGIPSFQVSDSSVEERPPVSIGADPDRAVENY
jgi:hypothetical protein